MNGQYFGRYQMNESKINMSNFLFIYSYSLREAYRLCAPNHEKNNWYNDSLFFIKKIVTNSNQTHAILC